MSRLFDALKRSEGERSEADFPGMSALVTELLQAGESQVAKAETDDLMLRQPKAADLAQFQSLPVAFLPHSRIVSVTDKDSLGAEKFRFLGVRLRQLQQKRPLQTVLVTSTIPGEGKSMVAANLACTLARKQQQKILLVDGDLRRPIQALQFGLGNISGVSEWLQSEGSQVPNLYRLQDAGIWFMPAGSAPQNSLELLQSGKLATLMDQLKSWFDWIVIDSPPVLPLADTSVWMRLSDGILLVTRQGITEKRQLQRGLEVLEQAKLIGTVLNSSTSTDHGDYYQRYAPSRDK